MTDAFDHPEDAVCPSKRLETDGHDCDYEAHSNPRCRCNTTDDQRADMLAEYVDRVTEEFGEEPLLMPPGDGKEPIIKDRGIKLDSAEAQSLRVDADEAVRRIREKGARGFLIYAGRPDHNTEHLALVDHDDIDAFPAPTSDPTLEVLSGSGRGTHETYRNDPDDPVANARVNGGAHGEIQAVNQPCVAPGSIHPSGGIYHIVEDRAIATLSDADLSDELRPARSSKASNGKSQEVDPDEHIIALTRVLPDEDDELLLETKDMVRAFQREATVPFDFVMKRCRGGPGELEELRELTEQASGGSWPEVLDYETIKTLYGVFRWQGATDERARELAYVWYTNYVREFPKTTCGEDRDTWLDNAEYRARVMQAATDDFSLPKWIRFYNRTDRRRTSSERPEEPEYPTTGRASFVNEQMIRLALDVRTGEVVPWGETPDGTMTLPATTPEEIRWGIARTYLVAVPIEYVRDRLFKKKKKTKFRPPSESHESGRPRDSCPDREVCTTGISYSTSSELWAEVQLMGINITKSTFETYLGDLQKDGAVKLAICYSRSNGERYVYYPSNLPDPMDADIVRTGGEEYVPGKEDKNEVESRPDDPDGGSGGLSVVLDEPSTPRAPATPDYPRATPEQPVAPAARVTDRPPPRPFLAR